MRFCAASMRSCFFIKKVWGLQVALLTWKRLLCSPVCEIHCGSSPVLDGNSYHLLQFSFLLKTITTHVLEESKRSSKVTRCDDYEPCPNITNLSSLLMDCHLQVNSLNRIPLSSLRHKLL